MTALGYLDEVYPGHTTRAVCRCGWVSARMPTVRAARDQYEAHYRESHDPGNVTTPPGSDGVV